jgi:hypothetical protein
MTAREGVMACEALGLDKQEMEKVITCYVTCYFCFVVWCCHHFVYTKCTACQPEAVTTCLQSCLPALTCLELRQAPWLSCCFCHGAVQLGPLCWGGSPTLHFCMVHCCYLDHCTTPSAAGRCGHFCKPQLIFIVPECQSDSGTHRCCCSSHQSDCCYPCLTNRSWSPSCLSGRATLARLTGCWSC